MVPALVLGLAFGIIMMVVFSPKMARDTSGGSDQANATAAVTDQSNSTVSPATTPDDAVAVKKESASSSPAPTVAEEATTQTPQETGPQLSMEGLVVRQHPVDENEVMPTLGGLLDPDKAKMEILFTRVGIEQPTQ